MMGPLLGEKLFFFVDVWQPATNLRLQQKMVVRCFTENGFRLFSVTV